MVGNTATLPASVRRQAQKAARLHAEAYPVSEGEGEDVVDVEPVAAQDPDDGIEPIVDPEPVAEPAVEPVVEPEEPDPYEQRYKVLQGKYNAEVPRLSKQMRDLETELDSARHLLAAMEDARPAATPTGDETDYSNLVTSEERTEYGDDLLDVVGRRATQTLMPELQKLVNRFEKVESRLGDVSQNMARSAQDQLKHDLAVAIPTWETLNSDAGFNSWLNEQDLFTGTARRTLLHEAYNLGDSKRVIAFFQAYQQENAVVTTPDPEPAGETPAKVPLGDLVAPGKPKSGQTAGAQQQEKMFTQSEIARFYRDVTAGKFQGREKDKARIEKQIMTAANAGRVYAG